MPIPLLFSPFVLRGITFKNRIVVSPMCQYAAVDGHVNDWHMAHHARLALGGVGGAIVEATGVTAAGRITNGCLGLYADQHIAGMRRIVGLYRENGGRVGVQLAHAGRKASSARPWEGSGPLDSSSIDCPWPTVAPSEIAARPGWPTPAALSQNGIDEIIAAFADAARRALLADFDFVEIHGAHGYLLHSFVSPLSNRREDDFGGTFENRVRLPVAIARAIRSVWPANRPLFYRASVTDDEAGGIALEETVQFARTMKAVGIDVFDCSSGGLTTPTSMRKTAPEPGFQVQYAERIRKESGLSTMAVGLIVKPEQANQIVADGQADLVALGRELLSDPNWAYRAAAYLGHSDPYSVLPLPYAFYLRRRGMRPSA